MQDVHSPCSHTPSVMLPAAAKPLRWAGTSSLNNNNIHCLTLLSSHHADYDVAHAPGIMYGIGARFVHPLLERHQCLVCHYALRDAMQTECRHVFCQECLKSLLDSQHPICPVDMEEITQGNTFPDKASRREILNLEVYCHHVKGGCSWMGQLKELQVWFKLCISLMYMYVHVDGTSTVYMCTFIIV